MAETAGILGKATETQTSSQPQVLVGVGQVLISCDVLGVGQGKTSPVQYVQYAARIRSACMRSVHSQCLSYLQNGVNGYLGHLGVECAIWKSGVRGLEDESSKEYVARRVSRKKELV